MADLATVADFTNRYEQELTTEELGRVAYLLTDASALVADVADLATAWTAATLPASVLPVICAVVRRALDNPSGLQGETIGDYTWRGNKSGETSNLYLTADEKRIVRRAAGRLAIGTVILEGDLPLTPTDPRWYQTVSEDGYVIVNAAEPVDL